MSSALLSGSHFWGGTGWLADHLDSWCPILGKRCPVRNSVIPQQTRSLPGSPAPARSTDSHLTQRQERRLMVRHNKLWQPLQFPWTVSQPSPDQGQLSDWDFSLAEDSGGNTLCFCQLAGSR